MSERYLAWVYQDERDPHPELVRVEPTDQYCLEHHCGVLDRHEQCWVARWTKPDNECYVVDVVRLPKEDG